MENIRKSFIAHKVATPRIRMSVVPLLLGLCLLHVAVAINPNSDFRTQKHAQHQHHLHTRSLGIGNVNLYMDGILLGVRPLLGVVDPIKLPAIQKGFQTKTPLGIVNATGGFHAAATIGGFSSLYRTGNSTLFSAKEGMKIKASVGFKTLVFNSSSSAFFGALTLPFDFSASIHSVNASAELSVPLFSFSRPKLTNFVIDDIGQVKVTIKNSGFLGVFAEGLAEMVLNVLKEVLKMNLSKPLLEVINKAIDKISIFDLLGSLG